MKRYVVRTNESFLFESFERSFISVVLGPRRVGKATLIDHYMCINPERLWVSLNMDVLGQRERVLSEELVLMIEQEALQKIGGSRKIWVFSMKRKSVPSFLIR